MSKLDHNLNEEGESGVIAVLIAILISTGFVIALFVFVADTSAIYSERRVVQNSADSAAVALAQECAIDGKGAITGVKSAYPSIVCGTASYAYEFAGNYANINSPDLKTSITEVCGVSPLNSCQNQNQALFKCQNVAAEYTKYVRVSTNTETQTGSALIPIFQSLLKSNSAVDAVGCANVAWGKSSFAPIFFPIALPICDYTNEGTKVISDFKSNDPVVTGGCQITDLNGVNFSYSSPTKGFSLLANFACPGSADPVRVTVGTTLQIESSLQQVEQSCGTSTAFYSRLSTFIGTQFFLPVVTSVICNSNNNNCQGNYQFQVASFFSFKYLGSKFKNNSTIGSAPPSGWPSYCNSTSNCLYGTFSKSVVPGADVSTDPNFPAVGAQAVQLLP